MDPADTRYHPLDPYLPEQHQPFQTDSPSNTSLEKYLTRSCELVLPFYRPPVVKGKPVGNAGQTPPCVHTPHPLRHRGKLVYLLA